MYQPLSPSCPRLLAAPAAMRSALTIHFLVREPGPTGHARGRDPTALLLAAILAATVVPPAAARQRYPLLQLRRGDQRSGSRAHARRRWLQFLQLGHYLLRRPGERPRNPIRAAPRPRAARLQAGGGRRHPVPGRGDLRARHDPLWPRRWARRRRSTRHLLTPRRAVELARQRGVRAGDGLGLAPARVPRSGAATAVVAPRRVARVHGRFRLLHVRAVHRLPRCSRPGRDHCVVPLAGAPGAGSSGTATGAFGRRRTTPAGHGVCGRLRDRLGAQDRSAPDRTSSAAPLTTSWPTSRRCAPTPPCSFASAYRRFSASIPRPRRSSSSSPVMRRRGRRRSRWWSYSPGRRLGHGASPGFAGRSPAPWPALQEASTPRAWWSCWCRCPCSSSCSAPTRKTSTRTATSSRG